MPRDACIINTKGHVYYLHKKLRGATARRDTGRNWREAGVERGEHAQPWQLRAWLGQRRQLPTSLRSDRLSPKTKTGYV
jgi:hypothetical protein